MPNNSSKQTTAPPLLLNKDQLSSEYTEPFIMTGYRQPGTTLMGSIKYAFVLHNDVGNFWIHFISFVAWIVWLGYMACYKIDFTDSYYYPLLCFWVGSCCYVLLSSMAHLLSTISSNVRSVLFIFDYFGITIYSLGGVIGGFFYEQSTNSSLFKYQGFIILLGVAFAISATFFNGMTRFYWRKYRVMVRALAFIVPYGLSVTPVTQRLFECMITENQCIQETMFFHFSGYVLTFMTIFLFASNLPERLAPGKFDYFFQSHQLFHVTSVLETCIKMYAFPLDAQLRRSVLANIEGGTATVYNTFLPLSVALLGGLLVTGVMSLLIIRGVLVYKATVNRDMKNK